MAYASVDTVATLLKLTRPGELTDDERDAVVVMLDWAEAQILDRYPDVLSGDAHKLSQLQQVETAAVLRVLKNPHGIRQFSGSLDDGSESGTVDPSLSSGALYIADDEWAMLERSITGGGGAFSITPGYTGDGLGWYDSTTSRALSRTGWLRW